MVKTTSPGMLHRRVHYDAMQLEEDCLVQKRVWHCVKQHQALLSSCSYKQISFQRETLGHFEPTRQTEGCELTLLLPSILLANRKEYRNTIEKKAT